MTNEDEKWDWLGNELASVFQSELFDLRKRMVLEFCGDLRDPERNGSVLLAWTYACLKQGVLTDNLVETGELSAEVRVCPVCFTDHRQTKAD